MADAGTVLPMNQALHVGLTTLRRRPDHLGAWLRRATPSRCMKRWSADVFYRSSQWFTRSSGQVGRFLIRSSSRTTLMERKDTLRWLSR